MSSSFLTSWTKEQAGLDFPETEDVSNVKRTSSRQKSVTIGRRNSYIPDGLCWVSYTRMSPGPQANPMCLPSPTAGIFCIKKRRDTYILIII